MQGLPWNRIERQRINRVLVDGDHVCGRPTVPHVGLVYAIIQVTPHSAEAE